MPKKSPASALPADEELSFEQLLQRLEKIVQELETGQFGLTDSLARYEEGIGHLKRCYEILEGAERQVSLITGAQPDGQPLLQPLDASADSLAEKAATRSERRSR